MFFFELVEIQVLPVKMIIDVNVMTTEILPKPLGRAPAETRRLENKIGHTACRSHFPRKHPPRNMWIRMYSASLRGAGHHCGDGYNRYRDNKCGNDAETEHALVNDFWVDCPPAAINQAHHRQHIQRVLNVAVTDIA